MEIDKSFDKSFNIKAGYVKTKTWLKIFLALVFMFSISSYAKNVELLTAIFTPYGDERFFDILDSFYRNLSKKHVCHFLIISNSENSILINEHFTNRLSNYKETTFIDTENKENLIVESINSGIKKFLSSPYNFDFKVLLATSDNIEPVIENYDDVIMKAMEKNFPDYDGTLDFNDGKTFFPSFFWILGKKYYDRFGYVFNPVYKSFYANDESRMVARIQDKEFFYYDTILSSSSFPKSMSELDYLHEDLEDIKNRDKNLFIKRRKNNFGLNEYELFEKDWSILVCTIYGREKYFEQLYAEIIKQIFEENLQDKVEVLFEKNKKGIGSIGKNRNSLLRKACGRYLNFIDDDDRIHPEYVKEIYKRIEKNPDTVGMKVETSIDGNAYSTEIFSTAYSRYHRAYPFNYGPPNHLSPTRSILAKQFLFPNTSQGEDSKRGAEMAKTGLVKTEESLDFPIYFYDYQSTKPEDEKEKEYSFKIHKFEEILTAAENYKKVKKFDLARKYYKLFLSFLMDKENKLVKEKDFNKKLAKTLDLLDEQTILISPILEIGNGYFSSKNPLCYLFAKLTMDQSYVNMLPETERIYYDFVRYNLIGLGAFDARRCKDGEKASKYLMKMYPNYEAAKYNQNLYRRCNLPEINIDSKKYDKLLDEAKSFEKNFDWPNALEKYLDAFVMWPENTESLKKIAEHYKKSNKKNLFKSLQSIIDEYEDKKKTPYEESDKELLRFCTASDDNYFPLLLNLIGSIHKTNFENLKEITVVNIGLNFEQVSMLNSMEKVNVLELEKFNPKFTEKYLVNKDLGKFVPGWYAWKPVAVNQCLEEHGYTLWIDAAMTVLKPIDILFKYIKSKGYFLSTVIDGKFNGGLATRMGTTKTLIDRFNLDSPFLQDVLKKEMVTSAIVGVTEESKNLFLESWYELAKEGMKYFEDDGTTPEGFGHGKHDQAALSVIVWLLGDDLKVHPTFHDQSKPMQLEYDNKKTDFYFTAEFPDHRTHIHHSRGYPIALHNQYIRHISI